MAQFAGDLAFPIEGYATAPQCLERLCATCTRPCGARGSRGRRGRNATAEEATVSARETAPTNEQAIRTLIDNWSSAIRGKNRFRPPLRAQCKLF
jgi:hypothetical protein